MSFEQAQQRAKEHAENDAKQLGLGFTRTHPDGLVEYIPAEQMTLHQHKPVHVSVNEDIPKLLRACASGSDHIQSGQAVIFEAGAKEIERLKSELDKAYRCITGFYTSRLRGELLNDIPMAYHCITIAAAARWVKEQQMDGAAYFEGKHVEVLQAALTLFDK